MWARTRNSSQTYRTRWIKGSFETDKHILTLNIWIRTNEMLPDQTKSWNFLDDTPIIKYFNSYFDDWVSFDFRVIVIHLVAEKQVELADDSEVDKQGVCNHTDVILIYWKLLEIKFWCYSFPSLVMIVKHELIEQGFERLSTKDYWTGICWLLTDRMILSLSCQKCFIFLLTWIFKGNWGKWKFSEFYKFKPFYLRLYL